MNEHSDEALPRSPLAGRNRTTRVLGALVPIAFLVALAWFGWSQREHFAPARGAPIADLLAIAGLFAFSHWINSSQFWLFYGAARKRIGLLENWLLFTAAQLANHLPGKPGAIYRFRYLRVVHAFPYLHSAAVLAAHTLLTIVGASLAGVTGLLLLNGAEAATRSLLLVFILLGIAGALAAVVPLPRFAHRSGRIAAFWHDFHAGFEQIRGNQGTALLALACEPIKYLATAWRLQLAFALIGVQEPIGFFLVLAAALDVSSIIALTPAGFGLREAFLTGTAVVLGMDVTTGLLGAAVDRAVTLAAILILGGAGWLVTFPRLRAQRPPG